MTKSRILANDDNADQAFRLKMSHIQKIEYWFIEEGMVWTQALKQALVLETLEVKSTSTVEKTAVANDNLFQIALRSGEI